MLFLKNAPPHGNYLIPRPIARMFQKILIANRGEIACRVATTAHRLGIACVAVYSDADRSAKHVALCGQAIRLGPGHARESYLSAEKIVAAALASGAQAIHPGYGFLAENADFATKCAEAGLVFIGPPAAAISAMGDKSTSKALMGNAGVPLVPGYHGQGQLPSELQQEALRIGFPVMIKARAGGGGKGMRTVWHAAEFMDALISCKREARAAFADEGVLIEKYLEGARHIEIQIFADTLGHCVHLFERDCSVQRRHQKILEEAPAPGLSAAQREAMGQTAVAAARAVGYIGAGTVEFICAQDGTFYFMEMNTRLQVEHPVTEAILGVDLVEWQFRIADGQTLPLLQSDLVCHGHALEARLYAENPDRGFLPATGTLLRLRMPSASEFFSDEPGGVGQTPIRVDFGVRERDVIGPFYDPLIGKLVTWGTDRDHALTRMRQALGEIQIAGIATNAAFLSRLVACEAFTRGQLTTDLIERHHDALFLPPAVTPKEAFALAAAWQMGQEQNSGDDPWDACRGWRLNLPLSRTMQYQDAASRTLITILYDRHTLAIQFDGIAETMEVHFVSVDHVQIALGEHLVRADVCVSGMTLDLFWEGNHSTLTRIDPLCRAVIADLDDNALTAPMPGKIIAILAAAGSHVQAGTALIVIEAMKMEHTVTAPTDGMVGQVVFQVGDQVSDGAQLLTFTADEKPK